MNDTIRLTIRPAHELLDSAAAPQRFLLDPILASGSAALIYGPAGIGKSFLALGLALAAARGGRFLGWTAPKPHKVLYLDGEMRREVVAERLRLFGAPPPPPRMWLATEQAGSKLDLATGDGILRLLAHWREVNVDLIVIDSLSSLAGTTGNDPERWSELRQFLDFQRQEGRGQTHWRPGACTGRRELPRT